MHQTSNMQYYFRQAKDQFGKDIYTQEKHNSLMGDRWDQIKDHTLFTKLSKLCGYHLASWIKKYLNKNDDLYIYKDFNKSFDHWLDQISKSVGVFKTEAIKPLLKDFFNKLDEFRSLEKQHKFKRLPSDRDIWTPERLSNTYDLEYDQVFENVSRC